MAVSGRIVGILGATGTRSTGIDFLGRFAFLSKTIEGHAGDSGQ